MNVAASTSFLICSTPRSGTTLLCEALRDTGLAGRPEEYFQQLVETGLPRTPQDYFADADDPQLIDLVSEHAAPFQLDPLVDPSRFSAWPDYFEWVLRRGTTPNGVFGSKVMWSYVGGLVNRLSTELPRCAGAAGSRELLECALPGLRYVFVTREDKVGQAVSLWRALQTWRWRGGDGASAYERRSLRYSFEAVDHLVRLLAEEEAAWREWFDRHRIQPLTVVYEELAVAPCRTALEILDHIGVPHPSGVRTAQPRMKRQADSLSGSWVERYTAQSDARVRL